MPRACECVEGWGLRAVDRGWIHMATVGTYQWDKEGEKTITFLGPAKKEHTHSFGSLNLLSTGVKKTS